MIQIPFVLTSKLRLPSELDWQDFERTFRLPLPEYVEYLQALGEGTYSSAVRVYPPRKILSEVSEFRKRWEKYFFWDDPETELAVADLAKSVPICDSLDGDEIVFVPAKSALFVLPRHRRIAKRVGTDLSDAIHFICDSGEIYSDVDFRWFESWVDRTRSKFELGDGTFDYHEILDRLGALPHKHIASSEEEDYISVICPDIEGSVVVVSKMAVVKHDCDRQPISQAAVLNSLGYKLCAE